MVSIKTALLQNDLRAEFMQDIPDQRDQDVLFGAVVPVKGRPGDACAVYKLRDMDISQTFFFHKGKERFGDALLYPQICFSSFVHKNLFSMI